MTQKCMPPAWKQKIRLSLAQTKGVLLAHYNQIIYQEKEQLELERLGCLGVESGGAGRTRWLSYQIWRYVDWAAPESAETWGHAFFDMTKKDKAEGWTHCETLGGPESVMEGDTCIATAEDAVSYLQGQLKETYGITPKEQSRFTVGMVVFLKALSWNGPGLIQGTAEVSWCPTDTC